MRFSGVFRQENSKILEISQKCLKSSSVFVSFSGSLHTHCTMPTVKQFVVVALVAVVAFRLSVIMTHLDVFKTIVVTPNAAQCHLVAGFKADGFEDVVYLDEHRAIACAGDIAHWTDPTFEPPVGSRGSVCVLIEAKEGQETPVFGLLDIVGFPHYGDGKTDGFSERKVLRIHGMEVVKGPRPLLFAVNHAFLRGGEGILVFEIKVAERQLVFLRHLRLLGPQLELYRGTLNDLAVPYLSVNKETALPESGTILVSSFVEMGDPPEGKPTGVLPKLKMVGLLIFRVFTGSFNTKLLRCEFGPNSDELDCGTSLGGLGMANGIQTAPVKDKLQIGVLADVILHELRVFVFTGDHFPTRREETICLPVVHAADNLNLDPRDGVVCKAIGESKVNCTLHFYSGVVGNIGAASRLEEKNIDHVVSPGGLVEHVVTAIVDVETGKLEEARQVSEHTVVLHNGTYFQATSAGVVFRPIGGEQGTVVLGSYKKQGLLVCPE